MKTRSTKTFFPVFCFVLVAALFLAVALPNPCGAREREKKKEVEKIEIDKKPNKYGLYIYRDEKFIRLPTVPILYSGVWFPMSLTVKRLAASFIPKQEIKDLPRYEEGDLLAIHYKNAGKATWRYYPLTRFPQNNFRAGINDAAMWQRPEGYYPGFSAIAHPRALEKLFGKPYEDGYRFDLRRITPEDIVYEDKTIVFARLKPIEDLPVSQYVITNQNFQFTNPKDLADLLGQLPDEGVALAFASVEARENFKGKRDYLFGFNEDMGTRYILTDKEVELKKNKIVDTGIFVEDANFVRFLSEDDFNLVLRPGEWETRQGWLPQDPAFSENFKEIPLTDLRAYPVTYRDFTLRYKPMEPRTEIRLQGRGKTTKVRVIYSPLFNYDQDYHQHIDKGWELFEKGDYEAAVAEYEKALEKLPEYPHALNNLAWLYATAKDPKFRQPKKALRLAMLAGRFQPVKPYILDTISRAFFESGNLSRAIEFEEMAYSNAMGYSKHYNEVMERYQNIQQHLDAAKKAKNAGDQEEAIKQLHFSLEKMPNNFEALYRLAWLYTTAKDNRLQDPELALDYALQAYRLAPDKAIILDTVAEAYADMGKYDKAVEFSQKALHREPYSRYYQDRLKKHQNKDS